jgi:hypothetical protein
MVRIVDGMFESCIGPGRCRALGRLKKMVGCLTSLIISMSSASVGFCPRERMTVPSSLVVIVPEDHQRSERLRTARD